MKDPKSTPTMNRGIWPVFNVLLLFTSVGGIVGFLYGESIQPVFQSEVIFGVKSDVPSIAGLGWDNENHDQFICDSYIVSKTLKQSQLWNLRSFDLIEKDKIVEHVLVNLTAIAEEDEPSKYLVRYESNRPGDGQVILNNLVTTYDKSIKDQLKFAIDKRRNELNSNLTRTKETLSEAKSENHSEEMIKAIEKREADLTMKILDLDFDGGVMVLKLESATHGKLIWPILPLTILYGLAFGFLTGFVILVCRRILRELA